MSEVSHTAARLELTIPIGPYWSMKIGRDFEVIFPNAEDHFKLLDEFMTIAKGFQEKYHTQAPTSLQRTEQPVTKPKETKPAPAQSTKRCKFCDAEIVWPKPFKPGNMPLNPDGSPHDCPARDT